MRRNRDVPTGPGAEGRRSFLRKAGIGSVGVLALGGLGDVLASPAANASQRQRQGQAQARKLAVLDKKHASPRICSGESECYPCSGCCGAPCKPTGVGYCFYCTGSCGQGVFCMDHPPQKFSNCCH